MNKALTLSCVNRRWAKNSAQGLTSINKRTDADWTERKKRISVTSMLMGQTKACCKSLGKSWFNVPQRLLDLDLRHLWGKFSAHPVLSAAKCLTPHNHYHTPSFSTRTENHTSSFTWTRILVLIHSKQQSAVWTSSSLAGHTNSMSTTLKSKPECTHTHKKQTHTHTVLQLLVSQGFFIFHKVKTNLLNIQTVKEIQWYLTRAHHI